MTKILFVNQEKGQCGVYQFGKNTAFILSKYTDIHQFDYLETENEPDFNNDYNLIILNHHPCTMPWVNSTFFAKYTNCRFAMIMHDNLIEHPGVVTLMPDPTFKSEYPKIKIGRPILDIPLKEEILENTIGSFGFGFDHKGFDDLIIRVNREFEEAHIRIHIPLNTKVDQMGLYAFRMANKLKKIPRKEGVKLTITHDYKNEIDLTRWLAQNTINVFLYKNTKNLSWGCSSTVDWAIAAKRPLAISSDPMFRHISSYAPELVLSNTSLREIINLSSGPLEFFQKNWTERKLYEEYCEVVNEILRTPR